MELIVRVLLEDMLAYARQARRASADKSAADLASDPDLASTVLWPLTMVGEAASKLPPTFMAAHADVAWRAAVLTRHRLVHGYRTIDFSIVRNTVLDSLPPLIAAIERLLAEEP